MTGGELVDVVTGAAEAFARSRSGYALAVDAEGERRYTGDGVEEVRERATFRLHNTGWRRPWFGVTDAWGFQVSVEEDATYTELPVAVNPPVFDGEETAAQPVDYVLSPFLGTPGERFERDVDAFVDAVYERLEREAGYSSAASSGAW